MSPRPRLVIGHDAASPTLMSILTSAGGDFDLVWLVDTSRPLASPARAYQRFGELVDVAGASAEEVAGRVAELSPDGVLGLVDTQLRPVADLAERLGLPGHRRATAALLTDKYAQRRALAAAGLTVPSCLLVPRDADVDRVDDLAATTPYPAVLKPRHGFISRNTFAVEDADDLRRRLLTDRVHADEDFVLEGRLGSSAPVAYRGTTGFADYVSVETVSYRGELTHVMTTSRYPLAPPFREGGHVLPTHLEGPTAERVVDVARSAATALGVTDAVLHTEIKVLGGEPVVLEVNGRPGGGNIVAMIAEVTGADLGHAAMRVAVGQAPPTEQAWRPRPGRVAYLYVHAVPEDRRQLVALEGLDTVSRWPEVEEAHAQLAAGDVTDPDRGSDGFAYIVRGVTADLPSAAAMPERIRAAVQITYASEKVEVDA